MKVKAVSYINKSKCSVKVLKKYIVFMLDVIIIRIWNTDWTKGP